MKNHCCICGARAPKKVSGSEWLSVRPNNDMTHYFCPLHKASATLGHCKAFLGGRIGCRISPQPNEHLWAPGAKVSVAIELAITHRKEGESYAYKLCMCGECGITRECTPHFDFYVRPANEDSGMLTCDLCINMSKPNNAPGGADLKVNVPTHLLNILLVGFCLLLSGCAFKGLEGYNRTYSAYLRDANGNEAGISASYTKNMPNPRGFKK